MAFPLNVAPYWKASGSLMGVGAPVIVVAVSGTTNGTKPSYVNILQVDTSQKFRLGTITRFSDESYGEVEAVYLKGAASTAQYDLVIWDPKAATTTRALQASSAGPCAVALSNPSDTQFGWYAVSGLVPVNSDGNCLINEGVAVKAGAAGQITEVSDTFDTGATITGMVTKEADGATNTGFTNCLLERPWILEKN